MVFPDCCRRDEPRLCVHVSINSDMKLHNEDPRISSLPRTDLPFETDGCREQSSTWNPLFFYILANQLSCILIFCQYKPPPGSVSWTKRKKGVSEASLIYQIKSLLLIL